VDGVLAEEQGDENGSESELAVGRRSFVGLKDVPKSIERFGTEACHRRS
jgi:hypothetical protein